MRFESRQAVCPFYRGEENHRIVCEGILHKSVRSEQCFESRDDLKELAADLCYGDFTECPIAKKIYERIEHEEENE